MLDKYSNNKFQQRYESLVEPIVQSNDLNLFREFLIFDNYKKIENLSKHSFLFLNWVLVNVVLPDDFIHLLKGLIQSISSKRNELINTFLNIKSKNELALFLDILPYKLNTLLYEYSEYDRYNLFRIKKKSGGFRDINSPIKYLKNIQRNINDPLQLIYKSKISVHGFVPNKSIISNAYRHVNKKNVLNIDIQDFFPSINFGRVRGLFLVKPFHFNEEVATVLAQICCSFNAIPQGAPTSPTISNFICQRMDQKLVKLAKENYSTYTRYADDITFSNTKSNLPASIIDKIYSIISEEGFKPNLDKTRNQIKLTRQEVTGLTVNEKVNINRKYVRKVRAILHSWETKGYEEANLIYQQKFDRQKRFGRSPELLESIYGKINFIGDIKGKQDNIYLGLLTKYNKLKSGFSNEDSKITSPTPTKVPSKIKNTIPTKNQIKDIKTKKSNERNGQITHKPELLVKFLKSFSNPDKALRNLVHKPMVDNHFPLIEILDLAKKEFDEAKEYLSLEVISHINRLFKRYKENGWQIWDNDVDKRSPLVLDSEFYKSIQLIKKRYRFGGDDIEETNLYKKINEILSDSDFKFAKKYFEVNNNINNFAVYNDVDSILNGIKNILRVNLKFINATIGNVSISFEKEKKVKLLVIKHINSISSSTITDLIHKLEEGNSEFNIIKDNFFISRCDWQIISNFPEGNFAIKLLDDKNKNGKIEYEKLADVSEDLNEFTHRLIFKY